MNYIHAFDRTHEKGSSEWNSFDGVREEESSAFQVKAPSHVNAPRYTNTVHIKRYPRHLKVSNAH
jgi:hypothetical protein